MLQEMAKVEGIKFDETLTGFKWLGNKAIDLGEKGFNTVFAFEEAIGFMCYDAVRDKDGVSALGVFSEWANHLYGQGKTVYEHLTSLYEKYGYWVSNNAYFICHDKQVINAIFDKIRYGANPIPVDGSYPYKLAYPEEINGIKVVSVRDLTIGYDSSTSDHKPTLPVSASSQMLTFRLANDCLMTLRTSDTEYKGSSLEQGRTELDAMVKSMIDICLEPVLNNLQ
ncbi:Phosphoglucomutase-2 [Globomyces sp. JEL0801]|nr:Phosphoglucomutase-2 [Globomyces sp. JEL0801]